MNRSLRTCLFIIALLPGLLSGCGEEGGPTATTPPQVEGAECLPVGERLTAELVRITDGDTIVVLLDGEEIKVRYIGVDTPESDEPFGPTASDFNAALLGDAPLTLVRDQSETDIYGRTLAYVLAGERFVNYELVRSGWAISKAYPPDTACLAVFDEAQSLAQVDGLGLWALLPTPTPATRFGGIEITPAAGCDPSYPEVCIPPAPPDLNCGDISFRNFKVLPPDPHHFDMNKDGVGCEGEN